jgi:hypothetical protein
LTRVAKSLFSRQGAVAADLARELSQYRIGDRIPTITEYAVRFGVGNGTIQAAMRTLEEMGAVQLAAKGHKGTHIAGIRYPVLWQATGREVVFGAMALPYTSRLAGLATGLKHVFTAQNVPFALAFMRGVLSRAQALKARRNDFIICSRFAGETLCTNDPELEIWCGFGNSSQVSSHVVLLPQGAGDGYFEGMRVCVDKDSIDQVTLTQAEFGHLPVKFLEVGYMQIPLMLLRGEADAAIWNVDEILEKNLPLQMVPLRNSEANGLLAKCTEAVIVIQRQTGIGNFLDHIIEPQEVCTVQDKVCRGLMAPNF